MEKHLEGDAKFWTLAKVQERSKQLLQDRVDNVSVPPLASYIYVDGS